MSVPVWVSVGERAPLQDQLPPEALQEIDRLHEEQHDAAVHAYCVKHRAIASICMSCTQIFRVVESQGTSGGLSHGWCSTACAEIGAARATAPQTPAAAGPASSTAHPAIRRHE